jgi:hypothetical protein
MTSVFRKTLSLAPTVKETTLSSQKEINNAVVPYVMGTSRQDWKQLSFLLNADTAELTQSLKIPDTLTDAQRRTIAEFIIRRGNRPFEELKVDLGNFVAIENIIDTFQTDVNLTAYEYDLASYNYSIGVSFPNFTRRIDMAEGRILNIPSEIQELILLRVEMSTNAFIELGKAKKLRKLEISGRNIVFYGLPIILEEFRIYGSSDKVFFDPNYHYECPHLHTLSISETIKLPETFVNSISESLRELYIIGSRDKNYSPYEFIGRLNRLETLFMSDYPSVELSNIFSKIRNLSLYSQFTLAKDLKPLVNLVKLDVITGNNNHHSLEPLLQLSPNLEDLTLNSLEGTFDFKGTYPQMKRLTFVHETGTFAKRYLVTFPNLTDYISERGYGLGHMYEEINFVAKTAKITISPRTSTDYETSFEGTSITNFIFDYSRTKPEEKINVSVRLPPNIEQVSFIVEGFKETRKIKDIIAMSGVKFPIAGMTFLSSSSSITISLYRDSDYTREPVSVNVWKFGMV